MDRVFPFEGSRQAGLWTAWPSHAEYWEGQIERARVEVAGFLRAFLGLGSEELHVWVDPGSVHSDVLKSIPEDLRDSRICWHEEAFGDIWFRDIAPLFVRTRMGMRAVCFRQNGWGGKYLMAGDERVAPQIAKWTGIPCEEFDLVTEGGALELDGEGTLLTTRSCVLNPNRNHGLTERDAEGIFLHALGVRKTIWLDGGLLNDHTDGHIDNIARFLAPGKVALMEPSGDDDPNADLFRKIEEELESRKDAQGRCLKIVKIPSPGKVLGYDGSIVPASYLNFLLFSGRAFVPLFDAEWDNEAVSSLQHHLPDYRVIGLPAKGILAGGGTFHCMTQQQPAERP